MSKKKAVRCELYQLHWSRPNYVRVDFLDKKDRVMMSSVDVVLNYDYLDETLLNGYLLSR